MFHTILVANRGEIACRVFATARRMGIRTVAVYSEADAASRHVAMADTAYPIGPAPARDSYLRTDRILEAARLSGAQAIHPGYGFLSENADFAEACAAAGLTFIGPPPAAIRAMGSKSAAKALMERSGVPLVPGYHGAEQDAAHLQARADAIGYPVLIKASAGGGGKGMRIVDDAGSFQAALALARGEARSAFGDDHVLIERYLTHPRHIEIQVFADTHGNLVSLFERDCSIQRRHQKVIEEAPAPGLSPDRRRQMGQAACDAARAVGYVGAGTVEFIVEDGAFYFMEMNTRLQVEHPVTEMITGQDLVEWQLRVAAGQPLPLAQDELAITGHAIEVRLYAEDPARDFLPSIGTVRRLRVPPASPHLRLDSAIREGDAISIHYDPMIAKLIVWDTDRAAALRRLAAALAETEIVGIDTNLAFLHAIATHPAFVAAELETGFIAAHAAALLPEPEPPAALAWAAAARAILAEPGMAAATDPHSPWSATTSWRHGGPAARPILLEHAGAAVTLHATTGPDGTVTLTHPEGRSTIAPPRPGDTPATLWLDGVKRTAPAIRTGAALTVLGGARPATFRIPDPFAPPAAASGPDSLLTAPMPARIVAIPVAPGQDVARGTVLMVLEAMKTQMQVTAPRDGTVESIAYAVDDQVPEGATLLTLAPVP